MHEQHTVHDTCAVYNHNVINTNGINVNTWLYHHHFVLGTSLYKQLTDYNLDIVKRLENKDFNIGHMHSDCHEQN